MARFRETLRTGVMQLILVFGVTAPGICQREGGVLNHYRL
jgi:hypothetical protein